MNRANLHPNPLSGYSEDRPDPEDDATPPDRNAYRVAGAGSRATKANSCGHIPPPPAGGVK